MLNRTAAAAATLAVLAIIAIGYALNDARASSRAGFAAQGAPQLYDAPYYYPRRESAARTAWDADGRCAAHCRAGGCTVSCR